VAERLLELDPLNENAHLILIQAHRESRQQQRARTSRSRTRQRRSTWTISSSVTTDRADPGHGDREPRGRQGAGPWSSPSTVQAGRRSGRRPSRSPRPANATTRFEVSTQTTAAPVGYRYRVLR
jgi:hypothetical protein